MGRGKNFEFKLDHKLKIKSDDLISHAHDSNIILTSTATHIFLFGEETYQAGVGAEDAGAEPGIEYMIANRFIRNLNLAMRANPNQPILIHMKTCGGIWEEGMAIYNSIKACPFPVTILNYTHARSMSSLIFLAANKRVMMPDTYFLFHDGDISISGTMKQADSNLEYAKSLEPRMLSIYVAALKERGKFSSWSEAKIKKMLRSKMDKKEDVFLTCEQALEWGFADEIFGSDGYDWSKLTEYSEVQLSR